MRETGSTSRVINLAAIHALHGATAEWAQKPLFRNKRLNTSIILKHAVRPHEKALFARAPVTATKIILPFALSDLRIGGASIFVGQIDFAKAIVAAIRADDAPADVDADLSLLAAIDTLPSFDPFLMRERLRQNGFEAARCYFDVSEADVSRMREYVRTEILRLVELAFAGAGGGGRDLSGRLADKLMTDETAQSLEPLRAVLRLSGAEYREGIFAWKGFLYYKWLFADYPERLTELSRQIIAVRILKASRLETETLAALRQKIVECLGIAAMHVTRALREYDVAFGRLADGNPQAFREFLLRAPGLFIFIGEAIGVIQHVDSFWRFRHPRAPVTMDCEEAFDLFQEFEASLSCAQAVREGLSRIESVRDA